MYGEIYNDYNRITEIASKYQNNQKNAQQNKKTKKKFKEIFEEKKGSERPQSDQQSHIDIKY